MFSIQGFPDVHRASRAKCRAAARSRACCRRSLPARRQWPCAPASATCWASGRSSARSSSPYRRRHRRQARAIWSSPASRRMRSSCAASMRCESLRMVTCSSTLRSSRMLPRQCCAGQQRQRVGREFGRRLAAAQRHVLAQRFDQRGNIRAPLAQWRHAQRQHVEAVVAGLRGSCPSPHQRRQVARGGGDHARIEGHELVGAQRLDLAFLQRAQQLGLQAERHVADLVEEQRCRRRPA